VIQICAAAVALAIPLGLLSGCGQKGPLYLPPKNGKVVTRPTGSNAPQNQAQGQPTQQSQPAPSPQTSTPDDSDKKKNDSDSSPKPN
jgi:predicted small lipoprotein YifL